MRFMVLVKASEESEAGALPTEHDLKTMGAYNEELVKAGVMLDAAGLRPSSAGTRISFSGDTTTVTDGPFTETKELVAGYWLIEVKSKEEAIEWIKRAPFNEMGGGEVEIRPLFELEDFGENEAIDQARRLDEQLRGKR